MGKKVVFKPEMTKALNTIKKSYILRGNKFKRVTLQEALRNCEIPYNCNFMTVFIDKYCNHIEKGFYSFKDDSDIEPISLRRTIEKYQENARKFRLSYEGKKNVELEDRTQWCIDYLKERGFKISKKEVIEQWIEI